jgi:hypothetical protein
MWAHLSHLPRRWMMLYLSPLFLAARTFLGHEYPIFLVWCITMFTIWDHNPFCILSVLSKNDSSEILPISSQNFPFNKTPKIHCIYNNKRCKNWHSSEIFKLYTSQTFINVMFRLFHKFASVEVVPSPLMSS